ncbi:MAG: hypothetical protein QW273_00510 [Candidatus Pacearchaeota archaeon]
MKIIETLYEKHYKRILIIPVLALIFSLLFLFYFYKTNGDLFYKDVSLTGGTTITIFSEVNAKELEKELYKITNNLEVRKISDSTGKQIQVVIIVPEKYSEEVKKKIEEFLGHKLTQENSSIETTSSFLSSNFYKQMLGAVFLSFFWMSAAVFLIFSNNTKSKIVTAILSIFLGILFGKFINSPSSVYLLLIVIPFCLVLIYMYYKYSIPSLAVIFAALSDIIMTLVCVNLIGMKISLAGIVAFLMLIGYSVDTDILLTTRVLRKKEGSVNDEIVRAFKTGITMSLTSLFAIIAALFFVYRYGTVLNEIFIILSFGLVFDIFNTWLGNAPIIKWYIERKK